MYEPHFPLYGIPHSAIRPQYTQLCLWLPVCSTHRTMSTVFVGPLLGNIVSALEEITKPHKLGIHLGIETHKLEKIEENHPRDVDRQMTEVIKHWLRNNSDCSWGALASAVEKMGGHGNLVKRLRDRHKEALKTVTTREV